MGRPLKGIIVGAFVSALSLGAAFVGFSSVLSQHCGDKYAEWMKGKNDLTLLRTLNIPGTHNTMALYSLANVAGKCQTLSLTDQLNIGVRFLDIRLKREGDNLKAVHGSIDQRRDFADIAKDIDSFLNNHPSEGILVSIKDEDGDKDPVKFENTLKSFINEKWYTGNVLPATLGSIRGKAILLSRFHNPTIGVNCHNGWLNSTSFTLPNDIYVQDAYKVNDIEEKKTTITACFNEAGHALKINFLSGYKPSSFPPSYAPSVAKEINPWVATNISSFVDKGVVLYDFVTTTMMDAFFGGSL